MRNDRSSHCTIALQELVVSGCLEKCIFSLNFNLDSDIAGVINLRCVNAAKISLVLLQTLARFDEESIGAQSTSLNLDNIFVKLSNSPVATSELDDVACDNGCEDGDPVEVVEDAEPLNFNADPFESENDAPLDFLSAFLDVNISQDCSDNNSTNTALDSSQNSHSADQTSLLGYESFDVRRGEESFPTDKDIFDNINDESEFEINWAILGMEVRACGHSSATKSLETSTSIFLDNVRKIQHVGYLIYQIFSPPENQTLPSIFKMCLVSEEESGTDNGCTNETDSGQRYSKLPRCSEKSLFTDLIEVGQYPISICRMLSDMIDIGIDGMADSPFKALEDVIDDLKQMSYHPWLYLDDPTDEGFLSSLRFGLGCYGRTKQVSTILGVTSNLEGDKGGETPQCPDCVEVIFVSGIAGSGKSFLIQSVGSYLEREGWIVLGAKFEMGLQHESGDVVSSVFHRLLSKLVSMRDSGIEGDIKYSREATESIVDALDEDSLLSLANLIPSIHELINISGAKCVDSGAADLDKGNSHWRLVILLSSLLGAILSLGRKIMIYYDDMQWSDSTMLSLICEVAISMSRLPHARSRFLLVGMYRDNEITNSHPFTAQHDGLQGNKNINITSINLTSLSRDGVTDMMMTEMRLPRRLIVDFSSIVHKKTSGHALFVVQLLNSLVRDSFVIYSPTKCRYDWDYDELNELQTWDSVASLIASNISTLTPESVQSLRVLSCLGMQTHESTVHLLGGCSDKLVNGIVPSLPILIDAGILESSETMVKFSHDLIRARVYSEIADNERCKIHMCIGLFFGSKTTLDTRVQDNFAKASMLDHGNNENDGESVALPHTLVSMATDHINNASELVEDPMHRTRFAGWNLCVATDSERNSNFQAALNYCQHGIAFLGSKVWTHDTRQLCYGLYKGIAFALLAIGEAEQVPPYATAIIDNVPFKESLEAQLLLIRSLQSAGSKNEETLATALALLRKLGFDMPSTPKLYLSYFFSRVWDIAPSIVRQSMSKTDKIASEHDLDQLITRGLETVDKSKRDVLSILGSSILAGTRMLSPYIPLIVCETVCYSLEHDCVCEETALSFCYFGYLKLWLDVDPKEGRRWAMMSLKMLETSKHQSPLILTRIFLYGSLLTFCEPGRSLRESACDLFKTYELGMKFGDVQIASHALSIYLRFLFFAGENLSSLQAKYDNYIKNIMIKYNKEAAKYSILYKMNIDFLMGVPCKSFSIFDGMVADENALLVDANLSKNAGLITGIYLRRFFVEFWMGNYSEAVRCSELAFSRPKFTPLGLISVIHSGARGIIAFRRYKNGEGNAFLNEGKDILRKLEKLGNSAILRNSVIILQAELYSTTCEVKKAKEAYEAAIRSSRNIGGIQYQALSYELQGDYLSSIVEIPQATESYKNAYKCYMQWGAVTLAHKIQKEQHLEVNETFELNSMKHRRGW